jgi:hypothetical protein
MRRTTAPNTAGGLHVDKVPGVSPGSTGIAYDRNMPQEEMCHVVEGLGVALDGTDLYQLEKALIARGMRVGAIYEMPFEETPVGWASARSSTNPGNPEYNPCVPLWDGDHDLTLAAYPLLVAKLRAQKAKAWTGAAWLTDHSVTVAAHVVTGTGVAWDALLAALAEDQLRETAAATAAGGYGYGKGAYTNWRCLNVGGTDYAITNVNVGAHTITITGDALAGAQTSICYPYRKAGSTDARVFQSSGEATVSQNTTECVGGFRRRDRGQGHWHHLIHPAAAGAQNRMGAAADGNGATTDDFTLKNSTVLEPVTDTTNGTPRTGGTTDPRALIVFRYMHSGVYLA